MALSAIIFAVELGEWGWGIILMYSHGKLGPNVAGSAVNIRKKKGRSNLKKE
jgi:hypothetical protein